MHKNSAQSADSGETNRLATATSPYLRQHATNPVDWYPWSEEALARARRENKPILLSIGYSACHWCHVMAHESFEDPQIAALMNEHFINIKVDREERPDLDAIYQKVVQMQGEGGGWPLTVFLTPEQEPFFGGTYFPPRPMYGRPGFAQVLTALARLYVEKPEDVERQVGVYKNGFRSIARLLDEDRERQPGLPSLLEPSALDAAVSQVLRRIDGQWGGFGNAPKFPNPTGLELLLHFARDPRSLHHERATNALKNTLDHMWRGGIYDHLRGGFARYSVDRTWLVPHFEKMLYDNAQLLALYAEAAVLWPEHDDFWRVAMQTVEYLEADMRHGDGRFYAATDADSEGVEGKFFCWTPAEIRQVLDDHELASVFCSVYGVTEEGNFEHGWSILHLARPLNDYAEEFGRSEEQLRVDLARARQRLLEHRYERVPPHRDEKLLTGWNALLISGLARAAAAAAVKGEGGIAEHWTRLATEAAERLVALHTRGVFEPLQGGRAEVLRAAFEGRVHTRGVLEDVAHLARACLDVHALTLDPVWLDRAQHLAQHALDHHLTPSKDGFYFTADDAESLFERLESQEDGPIPSGAAVMVEVLLRLDAADEAPAGAREVALAVLDRFRGATTQPLAYASFLTAAAWTHPRARHVKLTGATSGALRAWAESVHAARLTSPHKSSVSFRPSVDARSSATVCQAQTCSAPLTELSELAALLDPRSPG